MIKRQISHKIIEFIKCNQEHKNVLLVDGVRQVGKTTAIKSAITSSQQQCVELNLEKKKILVEKIDRTKEFSDFEELLTQECQFTPNTGKILFIDEANESLRLGHYVRQMKEDWPRQTVILSGSMMTRLFRDTNCRIPVGRFETITVTPFTFLEFLRANEQTDSSIRKYGLEEWVSRADKVTEISPLTHQTLLELADHYLICGGLPAITLHYLGHVARPDLNQKFTEYLATMKQDFLRFFSEEYVNLFDRAIVSVANILGQPYKKTLMIQNNPKLAENILSVFEGWRFITKIEQRTHNPNNSNSFHPKRYLFDVGLAKFKREMGVPSINIINTLNSAHREPLGGLLEQWACNELLPRFPDICGFREKNYEIDFIQKTHNQIIPIECKAALKLNTHQYRGLDLYNRVYQNRNAVMISLAPYSRIQRTDYTIHIIPAYAVSCLEELVANPEKIAHSK